MEPRGSLVPLVSDDDCCRHMQGLSLKNVELTVYNGKNKTVFREFGEMLFTHFGVSGPLVLSASAHLRDWGKEQYRLSIDLKPALDQQKLEARILRDISESPNRDVEKLLCGLVPHSMAPVMTRRLGFPPTLKANSLTKEQRRGLVELLKHFADFGDRGTPGGGSHRHRRRRKGQRGKAQHHGVQAGGGTVFCRRDIGRRRLYRRIQFTDRVGDRPSGRRLRGGAGVSGKWET